MNDQPQSIAKTPVLKPAEDFYRLRQEGISFIEEMGSQLWTDYNAHDPGITILEALCYAITELGYRTGWDIEDILTPDPAKKKAALASKQQTSADQESLYPDQAFFPAKDILTINPVTTDDFRRLLISLKGVRNAWVTKAKCDHFKKFLFKIKEQNNKQQASEGELTAESNDISYGLYDVLLEFEDEVEGSCDEEQRVIGEAKKLLHSHRNLCEDFCCIRTVDIEYIAVCANIEVRPDTEIELIQTHVVQEIENYFSPPLPFYTLQELLDAGEKIEEIFNGPVPDNGFIKPADLQRAELRKKLYTSDLINILMDLDGIIAIRDLHLFKRDEVGKVKDNNTRWVLSLKEQHKAKLWKNKKEPESTPEEPAKQISRLTFYRNGIPSLGDLHDDDDTINQFYGETERSKDAAVTEDIPIPVGTFRGLNGYFPVQYSLPTTYGIGPDGPPAHASKADRAKAKQLQGYLMAFEQILANSFSQLEHAGELFSLDQEMKESYFVKDIDETILRGVDELFRSSSELPEDDSLMCLAADDDKEVEQDCSRCTYGGQEAMPLKSNAGLYAQRAMDDILPKVAQTERRNRFLDHLLARFGESDLSKEYASVLPDSKKRQVTDDRLIADKISQLKTYPEVSYRRSRAFNYTVNPASVNNVPGIKKRIAQLLGAPDVSFYWRADTTDPIDPADPAKGMKWKQNLQLRDGNGRVWFQAKPINDLDDDTLNRFIKSISDLVQPGTVGYEIEYQFSDFQIVKKDSDGEKNAQFSVAVAENEQAIDLRDSIEKAFREILQRTGQACAYTIEADSNYFYINLKGKDGKQSVRYFLSDKGERTFSSEDAAKSMLNELRAWSAMEQMLVVEHLLLRPKFPCDTIFSFCQEKGSAEDHIKEGLDPFRLTFIMPEWIGTHLDIARREDFLNTRDLIERAIRQELPSHLLVNVLWVDQESFDDFTSAWNKWLNANAKFWDYRQLHENIAEQIKKSISDQELSRCSMLSEIIDAISGDYLSSLSSIMKKNKETPPKPCEKKYWFPVLRHIYKRLVYDIPYVDKDRDFLKGTSFDISRRDIAIETRDLLIEYYNNYVEKTLFLSNLFKELRNTYPPGVLYDRDNLCDETKYGPAKYGPVRLGKTTLGKKNLTDCEGGES